MRCWRSAPTLRSTNDGHLPTTVIGSRRLRGPVRVPSNISSQYLTSLLVIAPLIEGGLVIDVEGELTSKPYVDLTLDEMAKFGVAVENQGYRRLIVHAQPYVAGEIDVEGDASAASYFAALATLHGGRIRLTNLGARTRQGDYAFFGLCEQAGRSRHAQRRQHRHRGARARLDAAFAGDVDMTSMPDVAPTLMMLAPFLPRPTRVTGLATLRVKECDRIAAPTRELRKLGVDVEEGPDYMVIVPLAGSTRRANPAQARWKSRLITITASPCPSVCWDHAWRACGFWIPAAWPRPTRTTGATGSARRNAPVTSGDRLNRSTPLRRR